MVRLAPVTSTAAVEAAKARISPPLEKSGRPRPGRAQWAKV
jgi:hypothetical protein